MASPSGLHTSCRFSTVRQAKVLKGDSKGKWNSPSWSITATSIKDHKLQSQASLHQPTDRQNPTASPNSSRTPRSWRPLYMRPPRTKWWSASAICKTASTHPQRKPTSTSTPSPSSCIKTQILRNRHLTTKSKRWPWPAKRVTRQEKRNKLLGQLWRPSHWCS